MSQVSVEDWKYQIKNDCIVNTHLSKPSNLKYLYCLITLAITLYVIKRNTCMHRIVIIIFWRKWRWVLFHFVKWSHKERKGAWYALYTLYEIISQKIYRGEETLSVLCYLICFLTLTITLMWCGVKLFNSYNQYEVWQ